MEVKYTNDGGAGMALGQRKPYFLQRVDGAGGIRQAVSTFHGPGQDGAFFISGSAEMRNVTLEGAVLGDSPGHAAALQRRLLRLFTPKARGMLEIRGLRIPCVVEEVSFAAGAASRAPTFFVSLLCPSPFFEALGESRAELALWEGNFSFPLEIPEGIGIELGIRQPSQIIAVDNPGDVPCGCTVAFSALGSLLNPELMKVETREAIRLNKEMSAGETFRVHTHFAGKRVTLTKGGETSDAFTYMDADSTLFQLAPGLNTLRYNADESLDQLEVTVWYRPLYLGA